MTDKRKNYIDIAKGIAMLFVIIGHCNNHIPDKINAVIYSFHMPLFFAISGITFNPSKYKAFRNFICSKIQSLIVPYGVLCLLLWLYEVIKTDGFIFSESSIQQLLGILVSWRETPLYGSMWFVPALFCAEIPLYFLTRHCQTNTKKIAFYAGLFYILGVVLIQFIKPLPWGADLAPLIVSFLLGGYLFNQLADKLMHLIERKLVILCFVIITIGSGIANYKIYGWFEMYTACIGNPFLFFLSAIFGSMTVLAICKKINRCAVLEFIGKNTIIYYAFQKRIALPVMAFVIDIADSWIPFLSLPAIYVFISVAGAVIILGVTSVILRRLLPFVFGRKPALHSKPMF